jgi:simple sugar transport system substrate-binding protein
MKGHSRWFALLVALLLLLGAAACFHEEEEEEQAQPAAQTTQTGLTVYSVTHGPAGDAFWAVYRKGVRDAARDFGVRVRDVVPERFDVQLVVNNFESAIGAKPDGIIFTPTDPAAFDGPARRAIDQDIPLIALNVNDPRPENERIPYLFYIGGNEELGGRRTAERILEEKKPTRALCAIHAVGHVGLEARCRGFTEVMRAAGVPVDKLPIGEDPTRAAEALRGYFTRNRNADALFTLGPVGATPAFQVLEEQNLTDRVTHASFDMSQEQIDAIKDGRLLSTVDQQQYLQGYLGVQFMVMHLQNGFTYAQDILTGPAIVDKSNVATVEEGVKDGVR